MVEGGAIFSEIEMSTPIIDDEMPTSNTTLAIRSKIIHIHKNAEHDPYLG